MDICLLWVLWVTKGEVSASGRSFVQRSQTECGVSECDREASIMVRPGHTRNSAAVKERWFFRVFHTDSRISQWRNRALFVLNSIANRPKCESLSSAFEKKIQVIFKVWCVFRWCTEVLLLMLITIIIIVTAVGIHNHFLKSLSSSKTRIPCADLLICHMTRQNEQSWDRCKNRR